MIDLCWSRAERNGVISDSNPDNQKAESCESDVNKSFVVDDSLVTQCEGLTQAPDRPDDEDNQNSGKKNPAPVPLPTSRPKTSTTTSTTPVAKTTSSKSTTPKPDTSPGSTKPRSPDDAQEIANSDLNACTTARSQATQCCNNPLSCSSSLSANDQQSLQNLMQQTNNGPAKGQSIADYCNQMQQASASSGSVNNGLASVCYQNQNSCTSTCSSLVNKYQALVDNCSDCDAASIYSSTLASLQQSVGTCSNLQANANAMARQGVGSANGQAMGSICSQQAGFNPQSVGDSNPLPVPQAAAAQDPYGCQQNPNSAACQSCSVNPNSPACRAAAQGNQAVQGKAGFQTASAKNTNFNPADDSLATANAKMNMATVSAPSLPNQNQAAVVPNNNGGNIPGQTGQQAAANLASGKPSVAAAPGTNTDIMKGTLGASGGRASQGNGSGFESMSGAPARGFASTGNSKSIVGLDLKKMLPGVNMDPAHIAALNSLNVQIHGKSVDLFQKISERFQAECKLGSLLDCR